MRSPRISSRTFRPIRSSISPRCTDSYRRASACERSSVGAARLCSGGMVASPAARSMATGASMTNIVTPVPSHGPRVFRLVCPVSLEMAAACRHPPVRPRHPKVRQRQSFWRFRSSGGALPGEETCRCAARDDALDSLEAKRGFGMRYETSRPGVLRRGECGGRRYRHHLPVKPHIRFRRIRTANRARVEHGRGQRY
jgi:hypothetical protein